MRYNIDIDNPPKIEDSPFSPIKEFIKALGSSYTYSLKNEYAIFGFLWGVPVPLFSVCLDVYASGKPLTSSNFFATFVAHPIHILFLLHPLVFAVVFGAMGVVRYKKAQEITYLITELREKLEKLAEANERLKELDKMKSEFSANVTHELKTPLVSIRGYAEMICEGRLGTINQKQKSGLQTALRNIDRLQKLIDELLNLSRIESGSLKLYKIDFDLNESIRTALNTFHPNIERNNIELKLNIPSTPTMVHADKEKISHVLTNLLSNALKFTSENGSIGVKVGANGKYAEVCIWDTGCGIPEELHKHLFERFWQAVSSIRKKYGGTGLGLAIVKGFLDAHNSRIHIASSKGKGTMAFFNLPLAEVKNYEGSKQEYPKVNTSS